MANFTASPPPVENGRQRQPQQQQQQERQSQQSQQQQGDNGQRKQRKEQAGRSSSSFTFKNSPRRSREPWWDDAEDLELQQRRQQPWLEQPPPKYNPYGNPFERSGPSSNPFDSASSTSSSSSASTKMRNNSNPFIDTPRSSPTNRNNPFNESPRPIRIEQNNPLNESPRLIRIEQNNPFKESPRPSHRNRNNGNPFDESPQPSFDSKSSASSSTRRRNNNPFAIMHTSLDMGENSAQQLLQKSNSVLDSLDEFLDTTDETVDDSSDDTPPMRPSKQQYTDQEKPRLSAVPIKTAPTEESYDTNVSETAKNAAKALVETFEQPRRPREYNLGSVLDTASPTKSDTPRINASPTIISENDEGSSSSQSSLTVSQDDQGEVDLRLHDLCDEATSADDIAWRNAVHLLSKEPELAYQLEPECQMSPLHVCCLSPVPPPIWMIRALLYATNGSRNGHQTPFSSASHSDSGGRIPLHLIAATSADKDIMQLLVEEYPSGVSHRDDRGFTPLHLFLKNTDLSCITLEHMRILLGQTTTLANATGETQLRRPLQRHGEHLNMTIQDLTNLQKQKVGPPIPHENYFEEYPNDVKSCLKKLTQWKKDANSSKRYNKRRRHPKDKSDTTKDIVFINPASIPTPTGNLMPLHLLIRRGSLQMANLKVREEAMVENGLVPNSRAATISALMLVLISAHPEALMARDSNGRTPLATALLMKDSLPNLELVELLLGLRTPGYNHGGGAVPPTWAHDLQSLHRNKGNDCGRWTNPAMIPTVDTHQLPLHIAAEEAVSNYLILESICEAYPGARLLQDIRGRTPLHLALGNYRREPLDQRTFGLLFCNQKIAKVKDHDGLMPLDLVLRHKHSLMPPSLTRVTNNSFPPMIYQEFFHASIEKPRDWRESRWLLQKLRLLPPWLRRQACAAGFVKDLLVEELASPIQTMVIFLNGVVLAGLIISFRLALDDFVTNVRTATPSTAPANTSFWIATLVFANYHLLSQVSFWVSAASIEELFRLCVIRFWRWLDVLAALTPMAVVGIMLWENNASNGNNLTTVIQQLGTVATGVLWLSVISYFVKWSHGMAVSAGVIGNLFSLLVWPAITMAIFIVALAQMLFTLGPVECMDELGANTSCSFRKIFRTVHLLFLGETLYNLEGLNLNSTGMMVLITLFTVVVFLLILSIIVMALTEAMNFDRNQIALESYWEPKLALIIALDPFLCATEKYLKHDQTPVEHSSCLHVYSSTLEKVWHILVISLFQGSLRNRNSIHNDTMWYSKICCSDSRGGANCILFPLRFLVAFVIVPIWMLMGLITLGFLWPPQIRRWIFRGGREDLRLHNPGFNTNRYFTNFQDEDNSVCKLSAIRSEMLHFKSMCYEQTNHLQRDLSDLTKLILLEKTHGSNRKQE